MKFVIGFPVAIDCFVNDLPTIGELLEHREIVNRFLTIDENEADIIYSENRKHVYSNWTFSESFLATVNKSGSLPIVGSSVLVDTTFDLSDVYVTVAIGLSETFR